VIPPMHEPWAVDRKGQWKPLYQIELEELERDVRQTELGIALGAISGVLLILVLLLIGP
jgi:hypothetical protein